MSQTLHSTRVLVKSLNYLLFTVKYYYGDNGDNIFSNPLQTKTLHNYIIITIINVDSPAKLFFCLILTVCA